MSTETKQAKRGLLDWWDVVALVGVVWLSYGLYVLFGAGWAFVAVGALLVIGGVYGARQEAKGSRSADPKRTVAGQNQAR